MSNPSNTVPSPVSTTTTVLPHGNGIRIVKRKYAPRKSPLAAAIAAAEDSLATVEGRKSLQSLRIETLQAKIAEVMKDSGQFDSLIETLTKNLAALHAAETALVEAGITN